MAEPDIAGWSESKLGEILRLEYGKGLGADDRTGLGFPVYGSSGCVGRHSAPLVAGPGIVVGRKGTVGAVTWSGESFWPIDTTYYVEWQPTGPVDRRWTFWQLSALPLRRLDSSTGVPGLNRNDVYAMVVCVPPLWEQRRIAAILDAADDAIRSTDHLIAKLEKIKQGLIHDLLFRGIDNEGKLRDPVRYPEAFVDSAVGPVPRDWWVGRLGEAIRLQRGFDITVADQRPGTIPVVSSSGISSYHDTAMVRGPGVVIGRKGKLGDAYFLPSDFWPHDTTLWVTEFNANRPAFVALLLKSMRLERFDAATSVPTLNRNFVHPIEVALPPPPEQERIVECVAAVERTLVSERTTVKKVRLLKAGLTDGLLTGRIRVKLDEDAP